MPVLVTRVRVVFCFVLLSACAADPAREVPPVFSQEGPQNCPPVAEKEPPTPQKPPQQRPPSPPEQKTGLHKTRVAYAALPGWAKSDVVFALKAFRRSCKKINKQPGADLAMVYACTQAAAQITDNSAARAFFERVFDPYKITVDARDEGLLTAYYEPEILVSDVKTSTFSSPVLARPADLVTVRLNRLDKTLAPKKIMGRVKDGQLVPYFDRQEILKNGGRVLAWGRPIDVFFMQIQGSGRMRFADGHSIRAGFAGHNGLPYTSIGRVLVARGALPKGGASKAAIIKWLERADAKTGAALLNENRRYVFFKASPVADQAQGPVGTQGVHLSAGASLAIDQDYYAFGQPVFIETRLPANEKDWKGQPAQFLAIAQDSGGAIKGPLRGDLFLGSGDAAGRRAGIMKHPARWWVLMPKEPPAQ